MTIYERLDDDTKRKLNVVHRPKKKETFTREELEELMNMNANTYKKVKGRVRQQ